MHLIAERGIAAHWKYKEGGSIDKMTEQKFNWLRELVQWHQQIRDSDEFLENVKNDLFDFEIYVFTPKGEVKEFPDGATPLDFAYSVHTDLGNRTVGAKVNGRIVPLKHRLENGDTIEIITSQNQKPSKDWLKFCVTARAQGRIRQFIRTEERQKASVLGHDMLDKELKKYGLNINKFIKTQKFEEMLRMLGTTELEDLHVQIGLGKVFPSRVIEILAPEAKQHIDQPATSETIIGRIFKNAITKSKKSKSLVRVDGMEDVLVRYARCCNPIPGDPIIGTISVGRGVTIHQSTCPRAYDGSEERRVTAEWTKDVEITRTTRVKVIGQDAPGLLKVMSECFTANGVNISNAQISTNADQKAICLFEVTVKNKMQLSKLMQELAKIKGVIQVDRVNQT